MRSLFTLLVFSTIAIAEAPKTHTVTIGEHTFTLPVGFVIEKVTDSTTVPRPVNACLGKDGELYVTDSSGSNAKPSEQLKKPTHRVLKLESSKKNGTYDKVSVYADKLSFLQGILVQGDSILVSTPPTIQKLTDTNGDGVADKREVWFDGGVLTGCANDVHGPYAGPDGRIYFTKGGFGEQKLKLGTGKEFKTRAAHIYSAKPDGTDLRVEMTGGMDNPVDVAFNEHGEMFFTCTFLQHPANGKRDGIIHNTYGALYGKDHNVLDDHLWCDTKLTEPMTHLGPAAPSGLHCYLGGTFGGEYENNLFAAQFNLAKVSRHVLKPKGLTYETTDSDFVTSSNRDFHPTDVIQDHDGSLLIVDTGGWYKLCCPSSVFEKKDILGAVYRVRKEKPDARAVVKIALARETKHIRNEEIVEGLFTRSSESIVLAAVIRELIDKADEQTLLKGINQPSAIVQRGNLLALHALQKEKLQAKLVLPFLDDKDARLSETAWWVAKRHPDWGKELAEYFRGKLKDKMTVEQQELLVSRMIPFIKDTKIQDVMAEAATKHGIVFLRAMSKSGLKKMPEKWEAAFIGNISTENTNELAEILHLLKPFEVSRYLFFHVANDQLSRNALRQLENKPLQLSDLTYMSIAPIGFVGINSKEFKLLVTSLEDTDSKSLAMDALLKCDIKNELLQLLPDVLPKLSVIDRETLLPVFAKSKDEAVGLALVKSLSEPKVRASLRGDQLKPILNRYPQKVLDAARELYDLMAADRKEMTTKIDDLLKEAKPGDVRKGQAVFNSNKASCTACHKVAYVGGLIGPDLTKIGSIRSDRDLLEAIVFPSASFVRSYEPMKVDLLDGRSFNGTVKMESTDEITLQTSATETVTIKTKEIDKKTPGTVSIMPAGLDQQLTKDELLDLLAFLKSLK